MSRRVTIPYIAELEMLDNNALYNALASVGVAVSVDCNNWAAEYPYTPTVEARMAYSKCGLAILFNVTESHTKAVVLADNGHVWEDSCVEFFVANPAGEGYFNFELNAIGTLLAAVRTSRECATHFEAERLSAVRRYTSFEHKEVDVCESNSWYAVEMIPFALLGLQSPPKNLRANLYKCGDKLQQPHFLSWSPITLDKPNFHCPEFFGTLTFEL